MDQQFDAIYENGVLKPLVPLALPDQARVTLSIGMAAGTAAIEPQDDWERRLLEVPQDCGISLSNSAVTSEELYE